MKSDLLLFKTQRQEEWWLDSCSTIAERDEIVLRKTIQLITICLVIAFSLQAFSYTVVLKSGKRFHGTLVAEDNLVIQLKDLEGTLLSFKKSTLDLQVMKNINQNNSLNDSAVNNPEKTLREKAQKFNDRTKPDTTNEEVISKPGQAAKSQGNKTKSSRKITNKNIVDLYGPSAIRPDLEPAERVPSEASGESKKETQQNQTAVNSENEDLAREEQYWRQRSREIHRALAELKERRAYVINECDKTIEGVDPDGNLGVAMYQKQRECEEYRKQIEKELDRVEGDLKAFEDEGRRLGIPWAWIEDR